MDLQALLEVQLLVIVVILGIRMGLMGLCRHLLQPTLHQHRYPSTPSLLDTGSSHIA